MIMTISIYPNDFLISLERNKIQCKLKDDTKRRNFKVLIFEV